MASIGSGFSRRSSGDNEPAHYMLKVKSFSLLSEAGIDKLDSDTFDSGGYKWRLVLYPNGNTTDEGKNHISLYLGIVDTGSLPKSWEVNAYFKFYVYDHVRENYLTIQDVNVLSLLNTPYMAFYTEHRMLDLYPKGIGSGSGTHLSIYLRVADLKSFTNNSRIYVNFKMRVKDHSGTSHDECTASSGHWFCDSSDWGFSKFISLSDLKDKGKNYVVNDKLIIEVEIDAVGAIKTIT